MTEVFQGLRHIPQLAYQAPSGPLPQGTARPPVLFSTHAGTRWASLYEAHTMGEVDHLDNADDECYVTATNNRISLRILVSPFAL